MTIATVKLHNPTPDIPARTIPDHHCRTISRSCSADSAHSEPAAEALQNSVHQSTSTLQRTSSSSVLAATDSLRNSGGARSLVRRCDSHFGNIRRWFRGTLAFQFAEPIALQRALAPPILSVPRPVLYQANNSKLIVPGPVTPDQSSREPIDSELQSLSSQDPSS